MTTTNTQLPEATRLRIEKAADKAHDVGFESVLKQRRMGYVRGATAEYLRSQKLVEALEQFINHHETGLFPNHLTYDFAKKKLHEYNSLP